MTNETNQTLDQRHGKNKQAQRLRRQTLQKLQLGLRAVQMEKEATGKSAAEALQYTSCSEMEIPLHINEEDWTRIKWDIKDINGDGQEIKE